MKKSSHLTAFSLIEMSLVLLLISVVLAGLVKGRSLIGKSRLAAAQTITKQSPVNGMSELIAWFETSLDASFIPSERKDGSLISAWHDITPDASPRNDALQPNSGSQPRYYNDVFNDGIPGVRFDGADDAMFFGALPLINNSYTIFVVEQRESAKDSSFFIGGSNADINSNLQIGYRDSGTLMFSHYINDLFVAVPLYQNFMPRVHSFYFNVDAGKKYWLNGGENPDEEQPSQVSPLESFEDPAIGRSQINYYAGSIAEIIIFARPLQSRERELVENYLSKKYNIAIAE
jgi:hypothetical protein